MNFRRRYHDLLFEPMVPSAGMENLIRREAALRGLADDADRDRAERPVPAYSRLVSPAGLGFGSDPFPDEPAADDARLGTRVEDVSPDFRPGPESTTLASAAGSVLI